MNPEYRRVNAGAIRRGWSAAKAEHRAEPERPAPRALPWHLKLGDWNEQYRSKGDNHKRRARQRRQQKQTRLRERRRA